MRELLKDCIPSDHCCQVITDYYIDYAFRHNSQMRVVLDLGCGTGNSVDIFHRKKPNVECEPCYG